MRKTAFALVAVLLTVGCTKEKIVTTPCAFDIRIDWVGGSKAQFTVTPGNKDASYVYGFLSENQMQYGWTDEQVSDFQLNWMELDYEQSKKGGAQASFTDLYGYKGPRTIRETQFIPDMDWRLVVFQINPETRKAIGDVYKADFHTKPVPEAELGFMLRYCADTLRIVPTNNTDTWFWEYEMDTRLLGVYGSPYFFYYSIIDMYDQYGFLDKQLCKGPAQWVFSRDDRSFREDTPYTMCISGCADGEITTDVFYLDFEMKDGRLSFSSHDIPVEYDPN